MRVVSAVDVERAAGRLPISRAGILALGAALAMLGGLAGANLFVATFASVFALGALMLIGALLQLGHAFAVRSWGPFWFWMLSGLLYFVAAMAVFWDPVFAVRMLTLLVASSLALSGLLRLWIGARDRQLEGPGWIAASGVISLLFGLGIVLTWPASSAWVLGLFLACDLLFQGLALLAMGTAMPRRTEG